MTINSIRKVQIETKFKRPLNIKYSSSFIIKLIQGFCDGSVVKNLPAVQEPGFKYLRRGIQHAWAAMSPCCLLSQCCRATGAQHKARVPWSLCSTTRETTATGRVHQLESSPALTAGVSKAHAAMRTKHSPEERKKDKVTETRNPLEEGTNCPRILAVRPS